MVILFTAYLYKKFGHRLRLNSFFQKQARTLQLQPVTVQQQPGKINGV